MATTKLDTLILQFRRDIGDNYNSTTGAEITAASEGGNVYTAVEIEDLVYRAIDEFMERMAAEVPLQLATGRLLAQVIPEYLATEPLSGGTTSGAEHTFSLPSDYAYIVSILYDGKRAYPVTREEYDSLLEGNNGERHNSPHFIIEGETVRIIRKNPAPDAQTKGKITYIKRQEDVAQGGATDIALSMRHKGTLLRLMSIIYHRDLGAAEN